MSYRGSSQSLEPEMEIIVELTGEGDRSDPADKIRGLGGLIFLIKTFLAFLVDNAGER